MLYDIVSLLQSFPIVTTTGFTPTCNGILEQSIIPLFGLNVNGIELPFSVTEMFVLLGTFSVLILII